MTPVRAELLVWLLLSTVLAGTLFTTLDGERLGLYHDDGVYTVTAKALAERGEYRIESVPGDPSVSET